MAEECVVVKTAVQWYGVSPILSASPWMRQAFADLSELRQLKDNWDGYSSPAIESRVLEQAGRVLSALEVEDAPSLSISPVPGGGVQLEWQCAGRELEIEILPDCTLQFLAVFGGGMEEGVVPSPSIDVIRCLFEWLLEG